MVSFLRISSRYKNSLYVFAGLSTKERRGRLARGAPTVVHTRYRHQCVHSPTHILTQNSSETHTWYWLLDHIFLRQINYDKKRLNCFTCSRAIKVRKCFEIDKIWNMKHLWLKHGIVLNWVRVSDCPKDCGLGRQQHNKSLQIFLFIF